MVHIYIYFTWPHFFFPLGGGLHCRAYYWRTTHSPWNTFQDHPHSYLSGALCTNTVQPLGIPPRTDTLIPRGAAALYYWWMLTHLYHD
jgi:hypothetical protein